MRYERIDIKNILYNGGLTSEEYKAIIPKFTKMNKAKIVIVAAITSVMMLVLSIYSFITDSTPIVESREVYIMGFIFSAVLTYIMNKSSNYATVIIGVYIIAVSLIVYGILLGIKGSPNNLSVSFMVFVVVVPILFDGRPIRKIAFIIVSTIAFIISVSSVKMGESLSGDILNSIVYSSLSILLSTYTTVVKCEGAYAELELNKMRVTDVMTMLKNRVALGEYIEKINKKEQEALAVSIIDIDDLKIVNDSLGHDAGDEIIVGASECIKKTFSKYGECFRIGGDEFCVIVNSKEFDPEQAHNELTKQVEQWRGRLVDSLSMSCGYVKCSEYPDLEVSQLIKMADMKMYENKKSKNKIVI